MKRIVITSRAGFIGSYAAEQLAMNENEMVTSTVYLIRL